VIHSPINMRNQTIDNQTLIFRSEKVEPDWLVRCTVSNCEVILEEPCWANFLNSTFRGCNFNTKKLCAQRWMNCRWLDCKFIGEYGFNLGSRDDLFDLESGPMVVGCDLSQTALECVIVNADLPTIKFPRWPSITILEPGLHRAELQSLIFPAELRIWWFGESSDAHPSYSSKTFNWDNVVRRARESKAYPQEFAPYADEVRAILGRLPYVVL